MSKIIITLTNINNTFSYDLELPSDLEYENLLDDIVQTIISFNPDLMYQTAMSKLVIPKLNMYQMKNGETLDDLSVFNGDYLIIC